MGNWGYNTLLIEVITPLITGRGPLCTKMTPFFEAGWIHFPWPIMFGIYSWKVPGCNCFISGIPPVWKWFKFFWVWWNVMKIFCKLNFLMSTKDMCRREMDWLKYMSPLRVCESKARWFDSAWTINQSKWSSWCPRVKAIPFRVEVFSFVK